MEEGMKTSARNQLEGTVTSVTIGAVMAEIVVDIGGQQVAAASTKRSAERLALAQGSKVTAIIKATDVMIGVD
jgi:molybdate transport system regulatory protein